MSNKEQEFCNKILQTIKQEKIKPKAKWEFLIKNSSIWFLSIICLFIGSLAFAVIVYMVKNNDWDVYKNINDSLIEFILVSLPYFWLVLLVLFITAAHYNFKHTNKGYKFPLPAIIFSSVIISIVFGSLLYSLGVGHTIDKILVEKCPACGKIMNQRNQVWTQPEKGRLAGVIIEIKDQNIFLINDLTKQQWQVISVQPIQPQIKPGIKIRMIGQIKEEQTFEAIKILPFQPHTPRSLHELMQIKKINFYLGERNNF